jgi:hypothetical protein
MGTGGTELAASLSRVLRNYSGNLKSESSSQPNLISRTPARHWPGQSAAAAAAESLAVLVTVTLAHDLRSLRLACYRDHDLITM